MKNIKLNIIIVVITLLASANLATAQQVKPSESNEVFTAVEQQPTYVENGMAGFADFLGKNLQYPAEARKNRVQGNVYVSFVVEKDGSISTVEVVKGVEKSLDNEAMRVVKLTKWVPGQQNGKIVRTKLVLPISYKAS